MHTPLGNSHVIIDGVFVNAQVERVVLAIKDYEPNIDVEWVPEGQRVNEHGDPIPAFKVVYAPPGQVPFILFFVKDESEFDMRVLARIIHNDQRNEKASLSEYEAWEEAQRLVQHQEYLDALEEAHDVAAHVYGSPLNTYKVSDDLIFKDGIPFNAARLKKD